MGSLIRKTELQGELYDTVAYGQQTVSYPRPFLFTMQPREDHPGGEGITPARKLCLYDNEGEHFQPGQDTKSSPVTRHLAQSRAVLFLFDPTRDPRFRTGCRGKESGGSAQSAARLSRQETILNEAAARIRRHAGLSHGSKYERAMIVILAKFDEWSHQLDLDEGEPWKTQGNLTGVDIERIEQTSVRLRQVLMQYCPETVAAAEAFAKNITYIAAARWASKLSSIRPRACPRIQPKDVHLH